MKENNIEKLQERLETLHVTQDARLACNADDLDIREEIAEVEEEIKELQDDINVNRENSIKNERSSIEEDIEYIQNFLEYSQNMINDMDYERTVDVTIQQNEINAIEHILSDYKRVLKENEELKKSKITYERVRNIQIENKEIVNKKYISKQKIKDNLIKYQEEYELLLEHQSGKESNRTKYLRGRIHMCQELIEER